MNELLSTRSVDPQERRAYWTEMICNVYVQLACDPDPCADFFGSIVHHRLPALGMSVVGSRAQRVLRTPSLINRSSEDYFMVSIQTQGQGVIRQDQRCAVLQPGDFALYDSTRPYELQFDTDFEQIVLKVQRDRLTSLVRGTEMLTASRVSGLEGAGHLLITMLNTLKTDVDRLQASSALAVANGVLNIVAAGLQTLPAAKQEGMPNLAAYHLARIKSLVDARLDDPELSVSTVSASLGLSPGHVHRLFKGESVSLTTYIWNQRLDACSRDLLDPRLHGRSVGEIAFSHGFNDAAHFSRAFKERFGCAPREWRHHAAPRKAGRSD